MQEQSKNVNLYDGVSVNMKGLRIENGLSQADVAEYLGIPINTYRNYENGANKIKLNELYQLAQYYDVQMDFMLGLTTQRQAAPPNIFEDLSDNEREQVVSYVNYLKHIRQ